MKAKRIKLSPDLSIVSGCPLAPGTGFLILHSEIMDEDHSIPAILDTNELYGFPIPDLCAGVTIFDNKPVYLSQYGQLWCYNGFDLVLLEILDSVEAPLRDIKSRYGRLVAVGSLNQIYESNDLNNWKRHTIAPKVSQTLYGLESIDMVSNSEAYSVGWNGECLKEEKGTWRYIETPTNLDLHKILCIGNNHIFICGDEGVILEGTDDTWKFIPNEVTSEKLWGLALYRNKVFVSDMQRIYEILENGLQEIKYSKQDDIPPASYRLESVGNLILWSIGEKHLYEFDGSKWKCLLAFE